MVVERGSWSAEAHGSPGVSAPGAVVASLSLLLVAVPFASLMFLVEHRWAPLLRIDVAARDALHGFALDHDGFVSLMRTLSWLGSTRVWFVVYAVVALVLLRARHVSLAVFVVVTVAGSSLLNSTVKAIVGRTRPVLADPLAQAGGWSFPSGHAQAALVGYVVLVLLLLLFMSPAWHWRRRLACAVAVVMTLAIGFSRIALGVHYLSDVLAGYLLGAAWVLAMIAAFAAVSRGWSAVDRVSRDRPVSRGRWGRLVGRR